MPSAMHKTTFPTPLLRVEIPAEFGLSEEAFRLLRDQVYFMDEKVASVSFSDGRLEIRFSEPYPDPDTFKENVVRLVQRTSRSFQRAIPEVVAEEEGEVLHQGDPYPVLTGERQVVQTGPGVYVYQGGFLKCLEALDRIFCEAALERGAIPQSVPTTVPATSLVQNGYVAGFPHQLFLVGSIHHDLELVEGLAREPQKYLGPGGALEDVASHHTQLLSPTVCYHTFESLRGQTLEREECLFTSLGRCHRNEGAGVGGLHRLQTFTMREIIYLGSPVFVEAERTWTMDHLKELFHQWKLNYRIVTASDAFFAGGAEKRRAYQTTFKLKYEMQLYLPHAKEWLAVASFNHHQGTLTGAYQVKAKSAEPLFSGCTGYGYERLAYALYAQKGMDGSAWPKGLKDEFDRP